MQIIHNINIHLDRRETPPVIDAVQGETGRVLSVTLFEKGELFAIPADTHGLVRYGKADMTGGIYDTLPNGEKACSIQGSTITLALPQQMLTAAGFASLQILLCCGEDLLSTFTIRVRVEADPSADTAASENYVNLVPELMEAAQLAAAAADSANYAATAADAALKEAKLVAASSTSRYALDYTAHWVDEESGALVSSTVTATSQLFPLLGGAVGLAFPATHALRLCYYDRTGRYLGKDTLCYENFTRLGISAEYARVEAIAANGSAIEDLAQFASMIAVYIPAPTMEDVERAAVAASQAQKYSQQAAASALAAQVCNGCGLGISLGSDVATYADADCLTVTVQPAASTGSCMLILEKSESVNSSPVRQVCFVNFELGNMGFYGKCNDLQELMLVGGKAMAIPRVAGRSYSVQLIRCSDGGATLRVTDCCTLESEELTMDAAAIGNGWGVKRVQFTENGDLGTILSTHFQLLQPQSPRVLILGDELVEGRSLTDQGYRADKRFASLIRNALGGNCFINARSGATAETVLGWFDSYLSAACKSTYAIVAVGTHDSNFQQWAANMQAIIAKLETTGATPVLMTLVAGSGANRDILERQNGWIRSSGYAYIDANLVTSGDFDTVSPNAWLYLDDGLHLNERGHQKVFLRAKLDVPELMG